MTDDTSRPDDETTEAPEAASADADADTTATEDAPSKDAATEAKTDSDDDAAATTDDPLSEVAAEREQRRTELRDRSLEGDREAIAELDADTLRELAVERAAKPESSLRYIATGKRKRSVARVILTPGSGTFTINGSRTLEEYFPRTWLRHQVMQPFSLIDADKAYDVQVRLHGGGVSSQAGALRHGLSRALAEIHPTVRRQLKSHGLLKLDTRQVERKKAGLKKARKRPQFSKR